MILLLLTRKGVVVTTRTMRGVMWMILWNLLRKRRRLTHIVTVFVEKGAVEEEEEE